MQYLGQEEKGDQFLAPRIQDFLVLDIDIGQTDVYSQPLEMSLHQGSVQISAELSRYSYFKSHQQICKGFF